MFIRSGFLMVLFRFSIYHIRMDFLSTCAINY